MSDYTPSAEELVLAAVNIPEAEARRGIAKVKADALRELALECDDKYEEVTAVSGGYGQKKVRAALVAASGLARQRADRIEGKHE